MLVITTGKKYIDIDGYASCIAYRELLRLQGIETRAISTASPNYSVTRCLLNLPYKFDNYEVKDNDEFIIMDLSNKDFFESFVKEDKIIEIIDHHPGYEEYWKNKLGEKSIIESIGSVATIIVEKYEKSNILERIDKDIAILLMAAILDNTLNFTADITSRRDIDAYKKLESITGVNNYQEIYFGECQKFIENNFDEAIKNDLKIEKTNSYLPNVLGQLTIWDINSIIERRDILENILNYYGEDWLINIISLNDNKSYIYCSSKLVGKNLSMLFDGNLEDNCFVVSPAKLRKEIINIALLK